MLQSALTRQSGPKEIASFEQFTAPAEPHNRVDSQHGRSARRANTGVVGNGTPPRGHAERNPAGRRRFSLLHPPISKHLNACLFHDCLCVIARDGYLAR